MKIYKLYLDVITSYVCVVTNVQVLQPTQLRYLLCIPTCQEELLSHYSDLIQRCSVVHRHCRLQDSVRSETVFYLPLLASAQVEVSTRLLTVSIPMHHCILMLFGCEIRSPRSKSV